MDIVLNGRPETRKSAETVSELIESLGLEGSACAVEINRQIVPKSQHQERHLEEGDKVEVVTLVGGG